MVDCIEAFSAGIADKREEGRSVYHSEKTDRPLLAFRLRGMNLGTEMYNSAYAGTVDHSRRCHRPQVEKETPSMLYWALIFLLVAIVAGALGFGGIAGASAGIAKILFFIFLVLLVVSLIAHVSRGRVP
jgi:uncharacterized membrane protein YtjA (UPF0391 family)